jgi:Tfp pilus assembly protein PilV
MIFNDNPNPIHQRVRAGLSLVEILIALTMTLIVLGAMMSAFQYASAEMQNGRATLEMANRVRVAENLLRRDLANLTVEPRPYIGNAIPNGYFEYIEGPRRDLRAPFTEASGSNAATVNTLGANAISYLGDSDDILAMTCRSTAGSVFRGRLPGAAAPAESAYAEISD